MKQAVFSVRWTWLTNKLDKEKTGAYRNAIRSGSVLSTCKPPRAPEAFPHLTNRHAPDRLRPAEEPARHRQPAALRQIATRPIAPASPIGCRATGGSDLQRQIFSTSASPAVDTTVFFTPPAYRKRDDRRVFSKSKRRAANSFPRKSRKARDGLHPLLLIFIALPFKRHISYSPAGSPGVLGLRRR